MSGNEIINEIILFAKKDNNSELEEEYSEIGKGKIDIVDVFGEELQSVSYVSGLIYGNRVENQRNVLAKFKYRIGFRVISDLTINTKSISQIMIGNDKGREEKKYVDKQPKEFIRLNQGELLSLSSQK